ncbi:MAG: DUF3108 domain-containing protein [Bacteroidales bacterium]|nr:DUF3108 domain-containing protein [Bacteroidales bacterium]
MNVIFLAILIILIPFTGFSQPKPQIKKYKTFISGERVKYRLKYGFLNAGEGVVEIKLSSLNEKTVYHARIDARTIGLADKLFSVHDIYESYFDTRTILPHKAHTKHKRRQLQILRRGFL